MSRPIVRILRLLMFCLFVHLTITVAAFVYLVWWQAILASLGAFFAISWLAKKLVLSSLKSMLRFANDFVEVKSKVLRGATIDVHSVKPIAPPQRELDAVAEPDLDPKEQPTPEEIAEDIAWVKDQNWYEIELTLFPDPKASGPMEHWDLYDLRLVPKHAKAIDLLTTSEMGDGAEDEVYFSDIQVIDNGVACEPEDGKFVGPARLRLTAGFPKNESEFKFRYYLEQFGLIRLPKSMPSLVH